MNDKTCGVVCSYEMLDNEKCKYYKRKLGILLFKNGLKTCA